MPSPPEPSSLHSVSPVLFCTYIHIRSWIICHHAQSGCRVVHIWIVVDAPDWQAGLFPFAKCWYGGALCRPPRSLFFGFSRCIPSPKNVSFPFDRRTISILSSSSSLSSRTPLTVIFSLYFSYISPPYVRSCTCLSLVLGVLIPSPYGRLLSCFACEICCRMSAYMLAGVLVFSRAC